MALKKPSDLFGNKADENKIQIIESDNTLRDELSKVENLSEQVIQLQQELSQKVIKSDLESLVLSQINIMQENFEYLQNDFRKSNKKDIVEFKEKVSELTEIVGNLVENELPKYRKQVTKNEVAIDEKFNKFIVGIRNEIDTKVNDIAEVIDTNLESFNTQLQETSSEVKKTTDTYNKLSKILESKVSKENDKLEEYSQIIESLHKSFVELEESLQEKTFTYNQIIEEKIETISSDVKNKINSIDENVTNRIDSIDEEVNTIKDKVSSEISNIKSDVVINEQHIKNVDKYLQNHHKELVKLKEEVFGEIEQIPVGNIQENLERLEKKIDYIKETYSKIKPETIVREVIKEGLLNEPPDTKNSDPLTPLDQKFVTLDQLQEHYRLFINRIQQQLSTLGGGGETRLKYLDDIVGIATNASAYDGKYLQWNSATNKAEFVSVSGSDYANVAGISTVAQGLTGTPNISVGFVTASQLQVNGGGNFTGIVTASSFSGNIIVGASGINTIFSTTDITSWYYTNKSKSVTGDDGTPRGVYVGAAGTAMFIVGDGNNRIIQYTLSTPYDVSTAGVAVTYFSTALQDTNPTGIDFNTTGTKMFVSGQTALAPLIVGGEYVHEYSLSTAWNVAPTSVGYTTSFIVTQDTAPQGVTFGDSGSKVYVVGSTGDAVYQYSLSTPYSLVSGVTYVNISLILGTNPLLLETNPTDISFNSAGTVLWIVGNTQDRIYEFRLGTAWDISTAVFYDDVYVGFNDTNQTGLHVIPEQNAAYIVGTTSGIVYQYSTNTPAIEIASSGISSVSSIVLNNETRVKDKLYVKGLAHFDSNILTQGNIQVDGNVTSSGTLTANSTITLSGATASTVVLGTNQTTGTLTIGGATQTGEIRLGQATTTQTVGIATGVSGVGTTKTINLGTGGGSGSFTQINIGPTAGVGTVVINSGTNLVIRNPANTFGYTIAGGAIAADYTLTLPTVTANTGIAVTGLSQTFTAAQTFTGGLTASGGGGISFPITTSNFLVNALTSGALTLGAALQTGTITLGQATVSQTTNIQAGASGVGTTKTINLGTGGASGSFTQINIGPGPSAGVGTVVINSGTNLLVGSATSTGTASQPLQVTGGAYVSGSIGIGTTNPTSPLHVVGTALITGITTVGLGSTSTPPSNSQLSFELTTNTNLVIKVRGTDGVLRSANITLA